MREIELRASIAIFVLISLFSLLLVKEFIQFSLTKCLLLLVPIQFFATLFFVLVILSYSEEGGH